MRSDGRANDQLRALACQTHINEHAEGSCIFSMGRTRVHCTASLDEDLPRWRRESGLGWVTAEYRMLPRATHTRSNREGDRIKGRTAEIQRLIGRAVRAAVDFEALGPRILTLDCDVLQADGGTRTASINGAMVALGLALERLGLDRPVLVEPVAAVSVGIVGGTPVLDLPYEEDAAAEVDLNVVMTASGKLVEVQGTAEEQAFTRAQLDAMLDLAFAGLPHLVAAQVVAVPSLMELCQS